MTARLATESPSLALVVDDDPALRGILRARLQREGLCVAEASSGADALEKFDRLAPSVVLLDVVMPGLDGFATCRALRGRANGRHTPIVMLTGLDDVASIDAAYEAGATDFVPKPVNLPMLGHRLRYVLRASAAVNELAASQARLAESQRVAKLGSWEWDVRSGRLYRSEQIDGIAGMTATRFPGTLQGVLDLVHPEDRVRIGEAATRWLGGDGPDVIPCRIQRPDGTVAAVQCRVLGVRDASGGLVRLHGTVQDVTDRVQTKERVRRLAYYDAVTGLPNRVWLKERLGQMIAHARRGNETLAVLFLDIDHFKRINDSLGHTAGDAMLAEIAGRIERVIRRGDSMGRAGDPGVSIGRLGGDEFCVLLGGMRRTEDAGRVAQRMLDAFAEPFIVDGAEIFVTASIGMAVHPKDADDGEGLLKAADAALYQAKDEGRNNFQFFDRELHATVVTRLVLENQLRKALEREEFVLYYQPQVDAQSRQLVSMEALVRWNHPTRGLVSPGQFIPVAEECRLIMRIDQWVLREACRQNKAWQDAGGLAVPVSVNLSGHQFARTAFVDDVAKVLADTGLDPVFLMLEVTEGVLMADRDIVTSNLDRLKAMGVRLSLDDFGTGYSSLSYLKRLPLDELKIDQAFARDIVEDANSAAIVATIIGIGKTLGLRLVAEGIETEAQAACLQSQGCGVLQGYFFGRPQPADLVAGLLGVGAAIEA